ncbi:PAS domain S-box protein [Microvirga puerhi]|uniref:Blue-light-activated histidine kinase n=1 Tax=Microvirga puerhi TaxID=2876078 RepID=A0ABS7VRP6_9HYPH|nr:PAS domain S-box protein [Microvirga puerhi]MBZ6078227.1 PAS domain S-box protein [Microvirga puerhi]
MSPLRSPDFLAGGGEMGALMRTYDWSTSPLGPPETWSLSLRTLVAVMLGSRQPMFIAWGPDRIMLYNDGYASMCGQRHPAALGQAFERVWFDIMDTVGPILDRAYAGEATHMDDIQFTMHRNGYAEETHFAFSYTPVRDERGQVAGMFCACIETTQQVLAQRVLARTQERLSYALKASGMVGTWDWNLQTDTFYSDARFATMFSVDPEKSETGTSPAAYLAGVHPDDRARVAEEIARTIATGEKYTQEYRLLQKDGTIRWIEARGECLYDDSGKPWRFPGVATDITDRRQAETALRESEIRFRNLADNSPVMIWVTDPDGTCTYLSRSWYTFTGQAPETGLGFGWLDAVHPDDRGWSGEIFIAANVRHESFRLEYRLRRADGIYRWAIDAAAPRFGPDDEFLGYVGSVIDITERKEAERSARENETRQRQIMNSASDYAIITTDLSGRITNWSKGATKVLGWSEDEMLGQSTERFFTPEDIAAGKIEREMECALNAGAGTDERWHRRENGERFWASGEMTQLKNDSGETIGFVKVLRDRTEQRRAEEHQRLLINELNHRVKNTLTTVQALANQTLKAEHASRETRETFEGRLFALAKAHDVLTREKWEGAELRAVLAEVVEPYLRLGPERVTMAGPALYLSPSATLALAMAVHELATNASKYGALMIPSGSVLITWSVEHDEFFLCWQERGGPTVSIPARKGFGTRLIERNLAQTLGATVDLRYEPTGVVCTIQASLDEITAKSEYFIKPVNA